MSATYSQHSDQGGTLHVLSPTHLHHIETRVSPHSALAQLRRSLSRSPSKAPAFRLITSRSNTPSPSSPLSPSPRTPNETASTMGRSSPVGQTPIESPFPSTTRRRRISLFRPTPTRTSPRSKSAQRGTVKRALSESSDNGNGTPHSSWEQREFDENGRRGSPSPESKSHKVSLPTFQNNATSDSHLAPHHAYARSDRGYGHLGDFPAKSSPLKRSDGTLHLGFITGGSPAKRRSLHGASFGPDFDIFDQSLQEQMQIDEPQTSHGNETRSDWTQTSNTANPIMGRAATLRKTTLQQRQEKPTFARTRPNSDLALEFNTPGQAKLRQRMSLDSAIPPPQRDNPFSLQGNLPSASIHPISRAFKGPAISTRHPLSRTITQSSSSSSVAEDSPTHIPIRQHDGPRPSLDFSKSLPLGALRPATNPSSNTSDSSFATPENYKLAKPFAQAFMSTGLISKKNKIITEEALNFKESVGSMPDTPCKRPTSLVNMSPVVVPEPAFKPARHRSVHSFGTPSTPFSAHAPRPSLGGLGKGTSIFGSTYSSAAPARRGSFLGVEIEEQSQSQSPSSKVDSQSSTEFEIPPTPTKSAIGNSLIPPAHAANTTTPSPPAPRFHNGSASAVPRTGLKTGSRFEHLDQRSPNTPQGPIFPPDPSGLSISVAKETALNSSKFSDSGVGSGLFPPATPTTKHNASFGQSNASTTPVHQAAAAEVDLSITERFDKVQPIGKGEFSEVFRVSKKTDPNTLHGYFTLPIQGGTSRTPLPDQVFAVKKTRNAYIGMKDRRKKIQEVEILRSLGHDDHTLQFFDSWECNDHLYIQTEYCEEGSLEKFLDQVGRKARLDDFRIWKILLELTLGLKHVHDCGFIHLDLKPANILITFEGVLKIGDFGMATSWPAQRGIEGEGDREYIGPEILRGEFDKPADIFALGLMMLEIAGNVMLPENGASWLRLRSGDMSDVPSLTSTISEISTITRDESGLPISQEESRMDLSDADDVESVAFPSMDFQVRLAQKKSRERSMKPRAGELAAPPDFMIDQNHESALDRIVRWMINPEPSLRPVVDQLHATIGVQWAQSRRRAGATIYEGNWGPADEVLQDDAEMIDV